MDFLSEWSLRKNLDDYFGTVNGMVGCGGAKGRDTIEMED